MCYRGYQGYPSSLFNGEKFVPLLLAEELNNLNNQSMMQPSAFRIPAKDDKGPMDIGMSDHKATPIRVGVLLVNSSNNKYSRTP